MIIDVSMTKLDLKKLAVAAGAAGSVYVWC